MLGCAQLLSAEGAERYATVTEVAVTTTVVTQALPQKQRSGESGLSPLMLNDEPAAALIWSPSAWPRTTTGRGPTMRIPHPDTPRGSGGAIIESLLIRTRAISRTRNPQKIGLKPQEISEVGRGQGRQSAPLPREASSAVPRSIR